MTTPQSRSASPDDYPDDALLNDAEQALVGDEQLNLLAVQRDQLAIAERRARWRAFAAPLTSNAGAVISDPQLVELAVEVVGVFAVSGQIHKTRMKKVHYSFDVETIHRLLATEPMAPSGAACLSLAWKHGQTILGSIGPF